MMSFVKILRRLQLQGAMGFGYASSTEEQEEHHRRHPVTIKPRQILRLA